MTDENVSFAVDSSFNGSIQYLFLKYGRKVSPFLKYLILAILCVVAFSVRLFSVIRYESIVHEFDPQFNHRTTRYLIEEGFYEFRNWFDKDSWYPLGRVVGSSIFPGTMVTAWFFHSLLNLVGLPVNVRDTCVFLAPLFSTFTLLTCYRFTKLLTNGNTVAGLISALFVAIVPSYMSRSVAGSFDNECIAIFALIFSFYTFARAVKLGTVRATLLAVLAYSYMVASWGAYVFVTNTIAIYMVATVILKNYTIKHYVVYATWYVLGTVICLNIPFVGFVAIESSEHLSSHAVFVLLTTYETGSLLSKYYNVRVFAKICLVGTFFLTVATIVYLFAAGKTGWSGRSMTLLDPTFAINYIPIIASVAEHQATKWESFYSDLHILPFFCPVGLYVVWRARNEVTIMLGVYTILAAWFSCIMIRLTLVLSPAMCITAAMGVSAVIDVAIVGLRPTELKQKMAKGDRGPHNVSSFIGGTILGLLSLAMYTYIAHSVHLTDIGYSSPSIIMSFQKRGQRVIVDDFREAYYFLSQNTPKSAKVMSWWDYGYQIAEFANRTTLVDNNTWNNHQIATVGLMLASTEEEAYPLLRKYDCDYVLVLYGGFVGYSSDDLNKFLWPVRIASGVYPHLLKEQDFFSPRGYTTGPGAPEKLTQSLIYKTSYYRLMDLTRGQDYVRQTKVADPFVELHNLEEVFTSENAIVRIYRVLPPQNRGVRSGKRARK